MKIVFDNNVLISAALLKDSIPFKAFEKAVKNHNVLRSKNTFLELNTILFKSKFDRYFKDIISRHSFILSFMDASEPVEVTHSISICRDPKDNMYLELALSGNATCIVTGDSDLLVLHPFENILIVTPNYFLEKF
jgi:putative PIN family toxin of toxin-antitoxin system